MNICSSLRSSQRCFVAALEHDNINLCLTFSVMTAQLATAITHIMHHIYDNNNNKKTPVSTQPPIADMLIHTGLISLK